MPDTPAIPAPLADPDAIGSPDWFRAALRWCSEHRLWDGDATAVFSDLCGANPRSVKRWYSGELKIAGDALLILLAIIENADTQHALWDEYQPGDLRTSGAIYESTDRMLFVLARDPTLAARYRGGPGAEAARDAAEIIARLRADFLDVAQQSGMSREEALALLERVEAGEDVSEGQETET